MLDRFRPSRPTPWTVRTAFWATVAAAAVSVAFVAVRIATTDGGTYVSSRVHWFVRNGHRLEVTPGIVVFTLVLGILLPLAGAAIRVLLAVQILRGVGWARLVLSILVAIALLSTAWDMATGRMNVVGWEAALGAAITAGSAAGVVLLWLPVSNRYFAALKADRKHYRETRLR